MRQFVPNDLQISLGTTPRYYCLGTSLSALASSEEEALEIELPLRGRRPCSARHNLLPTCTSSPAIPTTYSHIISLPPHVLDAHDASMEWICWSLTFFPRIHLPHLETLTICNLNSRFGEEFHALKILHLRKTALPYDHVEGLKHLPSLTNLIVLSTRGQTKHSTLVSEPTVTRYLLEALMRNFFSEDEMEGMLPRLTKLELTVSPTTARELDTYVAKSVRV